MTISSCQSSSYPPVQPPPRTRRAIALLALVAAFGGCGGKREVADAAVAPALTVQTAVATQAEWPQTVRVSGPLVAWQEAIIGAEVGGQRLTELRVNVGDIVKKGEVLARFNTETLDAERAELKATWERAESDRVRGESLQTSGTISKQQFEIYNSQAAIAKARLDAKNLQLRYATVVAPASGSISARSATLGAIGAVGGEWVRLIVEERLEWRGELSAEQLVSVKTGQSVTLTLPDGSSAQAKIRKLSPALDAKSRLATAYADVTAGSNARAGMYASGSIAMQNSPALVVPAVSVVIRDGRSYVFVLGAAEKAGDMAIHKVTQQVVTTGRSAGSDIEISAGLKAGARVVTQGAGFLNDGDSVRVVGAASATKSTASEAKQP